MDAGSLFHLVAGNHFQGVADGVEHLKVRPVVLGVAIEAVSYTHLRVAKTVMSRLQGMRLRLTARASR